MTRQYRSGFEESFAFELQRRRLKAGYEEDRVAFTTPPQKRSYTPDWKIREGVYIETKGRFSAGDRKKALWVRECNPDITIYFLFQRADNTLSKRSTTTYRDWCNKNGFVCADYKEDKIWTKWFKTSKTKGKK